MVGGTSIGKSSGAALIIALYSAYYNKKIPSGLATMGAIDRTGNVTEIARLVEKIEGVLQKGTNIFVLPKSNFDKEKIPINLYNQIKKLHPVSNCCDLLSLLLKDNFE
jgi:ATP-dependent Lon protease